MKTQNRQQQTLMKKKGDGAGQRGLFHTQTHQAFQLHGAITTGKKSADLPKGSVSTCFTAIDSTLFTWNMSTS